MLTSTERLLDAGYGARVFSEHDLERVFGGSPACRYGLVNRALARSELVRLRRGVYCLGDKYREELHRFHVAAALVPLSYVSFESALSYHGWIPERVVPVLSACQRRSLTAETRLGTFRYKRIPVRTFTWFRSVARVEVSPAQVYLVADPLRALADFVHHSDVRRPSLDYLVEGLRVYPDELEALSAADFDELMPVHRSPRVRTFLTELRRELGMPQ